MSPNFSRLTYWKHNFIKYDFNVKILRKSIGETEEVEVVGEQEKQFKMMSFAWEDTANLVTVHLDQMLKQLIESCGKLLCLLAVSNGNFSLL